MLLMCGGESAEGEYENGGEAIVVALEEAPTGEYHDVNPRLRSYCTRLVNMGRTRSKNWYRCGIASTRSVTEPVGDARKADVESHLNK
jgi:hypothetical protein